MAITRQWLETKPAVTDKVKDGPTEFQARWKDVRELLNSGGHICDGVTALAKQGFHAVDAGGAGVSPDIYKADLVTKIVAWTDAAATLLANYKLNGTKNIPEATVDDGVVGVDAKGYKRALEALRIFESSPAVNTLVNIKPGIYVKSGSAQVGYFAGGNFTIGAGDFIIPAPVAAGNHAFFALVIDGAGALHARKSIVVSGGLPPGEVLLANPGVVPNIRTGDNLLGYIDVKDTSINFSLATAGANAFLVNDGRPDATQISGNVQAVAGSTGAAPTQSATVRLSKTITTAGGVVLAIGMIKRTNGLTDISIGRAGAPIAGFSIDSGVTSVTIVGMEAIAAGTYTYQLRDGASTAVQAAQLWLIELPTAVLG